MGNTPAYAGKIQCRTEWCRLATEHPRVCGENRWLAPHAGGASGNTPAYAGKTVGLHLMRAVRQGTPPRMRGKLTGRNQGASVPGNTPAYAGKTESSAVAP